MTGSGPERFHSADEVAGQALAALGERRVLLIGRRNRVGALLPRLLSRRHMTRLMGRVLWRRYRGSDQP